MNQNNELFFQDIYEYDYYRGIPYKIEFINERYQGKIYYKGDDLFPTSFLQKMIFVV